MDFTIRAATLEDCKDIRRMMSELAEHEKVADQVTITEKDLEQDGFSKTPFFHAIIAEVPEQYKTKDGHTKIGFCMYSYSYSSWKGRTVYMEDLYVMPEFRGKGIGNALMSKTAQLRYTYDENYRPLIFKWEKLHNWWLTTLGQAAGCVQINFVVLNWNSTALGFYRNQGCTDLTSDLRYHYMSCNGEAFQKLANRYA